VQVTIACKQIQLITWHPNIRQKVLINAASATASKRHRTFSTSSTSTVTTDHFENRLGLRLSPGLVRVIDQIRVKFLQLICLDKSALVSIPLFGKVFPTFVSYISLALSALLLLPIFKNPFISLLPSERLAPVSITAKHIIWIIFASWFNTWGISSFGTPPWGGKWTWQIIILELTSTD